MNSYDRWKLKAPHENERVIGYCDQCGREIYEGSTYYKLNNGDILHDGESPDCFFDYCFEHFDIVIKE